MMATSQTTFYPSLEALCTKYLVVGPKQPTALEMAQFPVKMVEQQQSLFEQFLLFDTVAIKIRGENVPDEPAAGAASHRKIGEDLQGEPRL